VFWERPLEHALTHLKKNVQAPVRLVLWDGREVAFSADPAVTVRLKGTRAASAFMKPSLLSLAEAYIDGYADVEGDLNVAIRSAEAISRSGPKPLFDSLPGPSRHSKRDDREAIGYHYDVSNEFYALWLDPRMVYSCAYFKREDDTLEQAQLQKLDHICTKLMLKPGEKLLDIGCGWGALAIRAAEKYGVDATGITLSENQFRLANERIRAAGLQDRCRVLLQDYRDVPGEGVYDKIASVGMVEHVGLKNLPLYFGIIRRLLKDGGVVLNHGITSVDPDSRSVGMGAGDFVEKYVFPHGELAHASLALREMAAAGLEVMDIETLRLHYAKTLWHWSERLEANLDAALEFAGAKRLRIWRAYLAGCAHAFEQRWVSIHQMLAVKTDNPSTNPLPWSRDWIYR